MKNFGSALSFLLAFTVSFCAIAQDSGSLYSVQNSRIPVRFSAPSSDTANFDFSNVRSFFEIHYLGAEAQTQKRIASPEWVRFYQKIFSEIEVHRSHLESQWVEFLQVYFDELYKRETQNLSMRPHGNKHTVYTYLSLVKDEVRNRIPENVFLLGYLKHSSAFQPASYVKNELEKIYRPHFEGYKHRQPSIARVTELMTTWMRFQFQQYVSATPLNGKVRELSVFAEISHVELVETLREYNLFYRKFMSLDPNGVVYGHRSVPGYTGSYRLSTTHPDASAHDTHNRCGQWF